MSHSLTSPGSESTGEIINNSVPLENSVPGNCCSALFKNLVRASGSGGPGSGGLSLERVLGAQERPSLPSPFSPSPILQLLKKIKRCERKGTESVTEEKCAVLFSTSFVLGPNKLPIQLQVK